MRDELREINRREIDDPRVDPASTTTWWIRHEVTQRAVVLLHGFTSSPRQYAVLGRRLFAAGHNVIVPRFTYHGFRDRSTHTIAKLTSTDMFETTIRAVRLAALAGRHVDIAGISTGGTLAAWAGARFALGTSIAISPLFGLKGLSAGASTSLGDVLSRTPNAFVWWDAIHHARDIPEHAYPRFSTRALGQMLRLGSLATSLDGTGTEHGERTYLIVNERDPIVSSRDAVGACEALAAGRYPAETVRLGDLPALHDVVDPTAAAATAILYPLLERLLRGESPGQGTPASTL